MILAMIFSVSFSVTLGRFGRNGKFPQTRIA